MSGNCGTMIVARPGRATRVGITTVVAAFMLATPVGGEENSVGEMRGSIDGLVIERAGIVPLQRAHLRTRSIFPDDGDPAGLGIRLAVEGALAFDPKLRRTIDESRVSKTEVWQAYAAFLPTVTASIRHTHGTDVISSLRANTAIGNERVAAIDASIPIFTGGSRIYRLKRSKAERAAARYDALAVGNDVMADAANAYLELVASRKRQEALLRSTRAVGRILEITRSKYQRGFADRADISLAQAKLAQVRREYEAAVEQRENAETQFRHAVGSLPPDAVAQPPGAGLPAGTVDDAVALAIKRNPRLLSARTSARAARFGVREAIGESMPRIDLTGSYENGFHGYDPGENWNIGVKLTVPLIDPDSLPTISRRKHEASAARYRALDTQRAIEKLIRDQWSAYHSAKRQLEYESQRLKSLRQAAVAISKRYEHGYSAIDDVLARQLEVLDSESALADLESRLRASAYRIAIETGS